MNIRQSTAGYLDIGPILDATGVAVTTEVVGNLRLAKHGSADHNAPDATPGTAATLTHLHTGNYRFAYTAIDANTLGTLEVTLNSGTNAMQPVRVNVETAESWDAFYATGGAVALASQVASIGSGTGAALNFAASDSNVAAPLKSVTFVGSQTANTYTATSAEDGTRHQITHTGNAIDVVYKFSVGAGRSCVKVTWKGCLTGSNDTITVQAYNGSTWDTRKVITGVNTTTNQTIDIELLSSHTGTGSDAGLVFLRFVCSGQSAPVLNTDMLLAQAQNLGQTIGYADGAVWVKATGTSGTTPYVHCTADNPGPLADCITVAASVGLTRFRIVNGETVTLTGSLTNRSLIGKHWTLALGSQVIDDCYIEGATITGSSGVTGVHDNIFMDCKFGDGTNAAVVVAPLTAYRCGVNCPIGYPLTAVAAGNGQYTFVDCFSLVAGSGTPYFNFAPVTSTSGVNFRRWSGGSNVTLDSNCTCTMEVVTGGGQTFTTGGANVEIRGICRSVSLVLSASETVQLDCVTGPVTITGTPTAAVVNVYGVTSSVTGSLSGATITDHSVSQESAAGVGTGAYTITVTVNDGTTALESAKVRFTKGAESYLGTTNASGVATFSLDAGTWGVAITLPTYLFTPTTKVVSATGAQTYSMTAQPISSSSPGQITGYLYCYDELGAVESGVTVVLQQIDVAASSGAGYDSTARVGTTNGAGLVQFTGLFPGGRYSLKRGDGRPSTFRISASASSPLALNSIIE